MVNLMYRAMIIDDEAIVRWGIRDLIDWKAEGFELCEDGCDGHDGLEKLLANKPELILVDIKMPGLSGIELIRTARSKGFAGCFIILTGYSEFEFAKSAISLGVEEYLLKPVDEEELLHCMQKVREKLDRKKEESILRGAQEDVAREELIRNILLRDPRTAQELEEKLKQFGIVFGEGSLCVSILADRKSSGGQRRNPEKDHPKGEILTQGVQEREIFEQARFQEKAVDFLRDSSLYRYQTVMDGNIVLIADGTAYAEWVQRLSERNERLRARYGEGLLIAAGTCVKSWHDLNESYAQARYMLEQAFLLGEADVLSMLAVEGRGRKAENPPAEYFLMLAEVGDMAGIREGVERFKVYCIRNLMKETEVKTQILYNMMTIRTEIERKYGIREGDIAAQIEELNRAERLEHVLELYVEILQKICLHIGQDSSDTVIRKIYYYMEKNYGQEMKLESFARMFNYNANYLGKAFRREIGDSFNNTLDAIRIANAKKLLEETDLKVYQISEQVGYKNIDYFYLKFRKCAGVSPKEYKRKVMKGEE